ncbi:MAG TPA: immunoglobulin domain-containing protein [Verrucomicrobiae bacterium]|nr:immunoglobulin domain-containing protein [Verrucomicrobiae bacterium]
MNGIRLKTLRVALVAGFCFLALVARADTSVDLEVGMTAATNAVLLGEQFSFSITVSNASANTATGVVLSDQLPAGWQYLYSEAGQGTVDAVGSSITFSLGTIPSGSVVTARVFVMPQSPGALVNTAVVNADQPNTGTTSPVTLPINVFMASPPLITKQPQSQLLSLGGILNLAVEVLSAPGTRYQWRLNGANIPGATNATYSILGLLAKDAGLYTAVVSSQLGAAESQPALITLTGLLQLGASDNFANRGPVLNLLNLMSYSNVGATSEPGEPLHAGVPGGHSVWFTWTPLLSGVATITTAGSSFDTLLAVYTGSSLTNLTEVASDDDSGGYYTSKVVFNAVAGTQYSIVVDGAYGAQGNIILNSSLQLLAPPVPHISSGPTDQITGLGDTALFSVTASGKNLSYQWLFNDAAITGATGASLQITNVDLSQVGIYRVRVSSGSQSVLSAPASLQIGVVDGQANAGSGARDKFQAEADAVTEASAQFKARLKMSRTGGTIHKESSGPSRGYTGMQVFSTYGSATQNGEPNNCSNPGGSSAWASLQPAANGALTLNTRGSNFKTILGVYTGNGADFSSLVPVACDVGTDTNGNNGQVSFAATANTTYYISVDGVDGAYGTVVLNWALAVPPAITSQTPSQTLPVGASVTLSVTTSGYPAPSCQWSYNGSPLPGATNWSLKIMNFQAAAQGSYQMLARNTCGTAATTPATLVLYSGLQLDSTVMDYTNGVFQFQLVGAPNSNYVIEASQDLVHWVPVATNTPSTGLWRFADPQSASLACRFYRALPQ